jgi:hypothetical protein
MASKTTKDTAILNCLDSELTRIPFAFCDANAEIRVDDVSYTCFYCFTRDSYAHRLDVPTYRDMTEK